MKKKRLKPAVKITIALVVLLISVLTITSLVNNKTALVSKTKDDFTYVNDYIFDSYYPVVNQDEVVSRPYNSDKVSIYKSFYDKDAKEEDQQKSLIYHEGIYMQNSGVDYSSDEQFDITAAISGTVSNITDDPLLGKSLEIKNSSEIITLYQSLSEVSVKKGDAISQGQVIGKSGTCNLYPDNKNLLHFEMYKNGTIVNPETYYDKSVKELTKQ